VPLWTETACRFPPKPPAGLNRNRLSETPKFAQIDKNLKSETGHGTQKPVECMRRPIENNASPGQAVYEPFSGSGTTIIAAEMTDRVCHAIEIAPAYIDVAVRRWQEFWKTRSPQQARRCKRPVGAP
jgi:DNA modification methylase